MTIINGVFDRTSQTRGITRSNRPGETIGIFDGRRSRPLSAIDSIVLHQTGFFQSARGNDVAAYDYILCYFAEWNCPATSRF